mmetsp:Transcript_2814/g.3781  ORF Transcript_2814/g.3781 Transcript_2814/m.3781 type:complete len:258 (-) Transcript_2814:102-875(-)
MNMVVVDGLATCTTSSFGQFSLDNLVCYLIPASATATVFTCDGIGSQVGYSFDDFSTQPVFDGGGNAQQAAGSIWTVENPNTDRVTFTACTVTNGAGGCLVQAFNDCTCQQDGGECTITTAAPTPAPAASPPIVYPDCPSKTDVTFCSQLLNTSVPVPDPGCQCYNFCKGDFQSCCNKINGLWSCGKTTCASDDDPGTLGAEVLGCHEGHIAVDQAIKDIIDKVTNSTSNANVNAALSLSSSLVMAAIIFVGGVMVV